MNYRIILAFLLVAYFLEISAAPKRRSMSSRSSDEKGKEFEKKEEQRFILKARTPRNLSSHERRIAKIFSDNVIPIAQGLALIADGKEVQTAREAKIKLREQKAQTALRSRTATGRHRHASTPSSRGGGGFGGTSWGGGGYRPSGQGGYGWGGGGGYRPTPNYGAPSSYSPSSTWGQSSPVTSYGSPSSSRGLTTSKSVPFGTDTDSDQTGETKKSYSGSGDKKLQQKRNDALACYNDNIRGMEEIIEEAQKNEAAGGDMHKFYEGRLKVIHRLVEKFNKQEQAFKKLSKSDQKTFISNYTHKAQAKAQDFLPYLLRIIVYPTRDAELQDKQNDAREIILKSLAALIGVGAVKSSLIKQDDELATYYNIKNKTTLTTPKLSLTASDKKILADLRDDLDSIISKFEKIVVELGAQPVKPDKLKALQTAIDALLKP